MNQSELKLNLRAKKLGILIYDARTAADKEINDCAQVMGMSPRRYREWETGSQSPSLPELETLSYLFNVPIQHFWGAKSISEKKSPEQEEDQNAQFVRIRQRVIGITLRMSRMTKDMSLKAVEDATGISETRLRRYEMGQNPIPMPELELICSTIGLEVDELLARHGHVGNWRVSQETIQKFLELPVELQEFVCKPVNLPYIELALRMSNLNVDKLRTVAEGILEITY